MAPVTTYVFLDLETTGLPSQEYNKTRIKEISLIAVKREHLLATRNGSVPRVQNKLTLCINPQKMINPESTATTGLCNDLLEFETPFNLDAFNTINSFLGLLAKPVCLIAYNGLIFDYPIIRAQVDKLNVSFDDLLCTDAFHAFYYILEQRKSQILKSNVVSSDNSPLTVAKVQLTKQDVIEPLSTSSEIEAIINENFVAMQAVNETTPKRQTKFVPHTPKKCRRKLNLPRFPWLNGPKPKESYKLKNVYERVLKREAIEAHRAENDCILLMEVVVALAKEFVEWVDLNNCAFSDVNPMTPGIRIGQ